MIHSPHVLRHINMTLLYIIITFLFFLFEDKMSPPSLKSPFSVFVTWNSSFHITLMFGAYWTMISFQASYVTKIILNAHALYSKSKLQRINMNMNIFRVKLCTYIILNSDGQIF